MKIQFIVLCSFFFNQFWLEGNCQEWKAIQASSQYYSNIATAASEPEAKAEAQRGLIGQVSSMISSKTDMTVTAHNNTSSQTFYNSSEIVSHLRLDGLKYQTLEADKKKNSYSIMAYISKDDLSKSADQVKKSVSQYIELMVQKQEMGLKGLSEAYTAYLYTFFTPYSIDCKVGKQDVPNLKSYLESMLRGHISAIKLKCIKVDENPLYPDEQLKLKLKMEGEAEPGINYVFECPSYNAKTTLDGQSGALDVLMQPTDTKETFKGVISLKPVGLSAELENINSVIKVSRELDFEVDMSKVIKIDFSIEEKGPNYVLTQKVIHISVSSLEWSTNDKRLSKQQIATVPKSEVGNEITLTVNGNSELSVSKRVNPSKAMTDRYSNPAPRNNSEPENPKLTSKDFTPAYPAMVSANDAKVNMPKLPDNIAKASTFEQLQTELVAMKKNGQAAIGKKAAFVKPENCWVFLIDENKAIKHLLSPGREQRMDLKENRNVVDFENQFKGLTSIWVEFY